MAAFRYAEILVARGGTDYERYTVAPIEPTPSPDVYVVRERVRPEPPHPDATMPEGGE